MPWGRCLPLLLLLCATTGCATTGSARSPSPIARLVAAAQGFVDAPSFRFSERGERQDCSGFVQGAFSTVGEQLIDAVARGESATEQVFRTARSRGRVRGGRGLRAGDLLFFHNTYDRNGNGLRDDRFTHLALVETSTGPRAVTLLHFASGRVRRDVMDLTRPSVAIDPQTGRTVNSFLRRGTGRRLTSQLFFKSARPLDR